MSRIYVAGPLFSEAEKQYNGYLSKCLEDMGFETFLPQRDGYELSELLANGDSESFAMGKIFKRDISEIQKSDIMVFVMDGRVPDDGACVEIGYAYAMGKECIGLKTDPRTLMSDLDNPMILGALKGRVARNLKELEDFLVSP
ncbi:nucleoside 2-deoxyribosyltransferase [Methanosarcinales archaeon]|nr:MAG: nucleoside 2-deoxyribosyltransferase [Methanosarcinales archaeon]